MALVVIKMKKRKKIIFLWLLAAAAFFIICLGSYLLYRFNYIPHKKFTNADFHITDFASPYDMDGDGVDDQTDILNSAYSYIGTKPKYKSKYYKDTGYPNDSYGVCTDVVAFSLRDAGYDLMELVDEDISLHIEDYDIEEPDNKIDFRRVKNLSVYFAHHAQSLTTDIYDRDEWQGGDIVVFKGHIGIVSDHRNRHGVPFVIHHANPVQRFYEEDILEYREYGKDIVGHYRIIPQ